jgi:hypothetical protein
MPPPDAACPPLEVIQPLQSNQVIPPQTRVISAPTIQSYELNQGVIALCDWFEVDSINFIKSEENPADALPRGLTGKTPRR